MLITLYSLFRCSNKLRSGGVPLQKFVKNCVSAFKCRQGVFWVSLNGWLAMAGLVVELEKLCLGDAFVYRFVWLKRCFLSTFKLTRKGGCFSHFNVYSCGGYWC